MNISSKSCFLTTNKRDPRLASYSMRTDVTILRILEFLNEFQWELENNSMKKKKKGKSKLILGSNEASNADFKANQ